MLVGALGWCFLVVLVAAQLGTVDGDGRAHRRRGARRPSPTTSTSIAKVDQPPRLLHHAVLRRARMQIPGRAWTCLGAAVAASAFVVALAVPRRSSSRALRCCGSGTARQPRSRHQPVAGQRVLAGHLHARRRSRPHRRGACSSSSSGCSSITAVARTYAILLQLRDLLDPGSAPAAAGDARSRRDAGRRRTRPATADRLPRFLPRRELTAARADRARTRARSIASRSWTSTRR